MIVHIFLILHLERFQEMILNCIIDLIVCLHQFLIHAVNFKNQVKNKKLYHMQDNHKIFFLALMINLNNQNYKQMKHLINMLAKSNQHEYFRV